ncbi:competence type IV pilus minor pilin ComGF [Vagococcus lutrae]|uniref:competence type IV pilus minor pilin ComGF n=1 Tax=Vagococcus lutrae TaxID=81947 RepID=UPI0020101979|nr:competence type IV pilus minor pilin ComGF [Vagococcus lutrae]UQF11374.1 ComGF family competence protein [Vagococcus lutrae]
MLYLVTYIETLIGILLLIAGTYFFSTIMAQTTELFQPKSAQNYYEWQTFLLQLEQELKNKKECQVVANSLVTKEKTPDGSEAIVQYEWYRTKVRKRRNGMGHHVLLTNVEKWTLDKQASHLMIEVVFSDGHHYSGGVLIDEKE